MKIRKIEIKGCETSKEVLLFIERDDDGEDFVKLVAWHTDKDGEELIQLHELKDFPNMLMMERFIADFSECSANEYANSFQI